MNLKNITQPFSLYLKSENVSENTLRNYLADTQHFLSWLIKDQPNLASSKPNIIAQSISKDVLKNYKNFLEKGQVSSSTINRRLSSLRKLSSFFVSQGWRQNNPGKKVANITNKKGNTSDWQILNRFAKSLKDEGKSTSTVRNYLSDVRGYLSFCHSKEGSFPLRHSEGSPEESGDSSRTRSFADAQDDGGRAQDNDLSSSSHSEGSPEESRPRMRSFGRLRRPQDDEKIKSNLIK